MSVRTRLEVLERAAGIDTCSECGQHPDGKVHPGEDVRFVLLPIVLGADGRQVKHPDPEPCPVCGVRPVMFTLQPMRLDGDRELA